jgi:DNA-binding MarR family transcriptional regulator
MSNERKMEPDRSNAFTVGDEIRQPTQVSGSIGYAIRRAQMRVYDEFFSLLADLDTTPTRYTLMLLIRENEGIRAVDLARNLGVAPSRMVKLIDDLERRKLISRETLRSDRRNRILVLTAQGEQKLNQLERLVERHEARLTEGFSMEDRECLLGLLWRIANSS